MEEKINQGIARYRETMSSDLPYTRKVGLIIRQKMEHTRDMSSEFLRDYFSSGDEELMAFANEKTRMSMEMVTKNVAYASRKVWVDRERYIPLREELYAKSGTLLKKTEAFDVKRIEGRWFPKRIVFRDMLKQGGGTEFIIESIEFNADIPERLFTKAALRCVWVKSEE